MLLNNGPERRFFMSEVNFGSHQINQPENVQVDQSEKAKVEAKSSLITNAVAKNGKEEPKGLADRIFSKLKEIFSSKSESIAGPLSLKFSQKVRELVPGKKNLPERASSIVKQSLPESGLVSRVDDQFSELSNMLTGKSSEIPGDKPPDDLPPPLAEEHSDTSFPDYPPPEFTSNHLPGGSVDDNMPIPTDLPPSLPEEAKARPKLSEKHEDAAPATLPQESKAASIRPGQNPITGSDAVKAKKAEAATAAKEAQAVKIESRNKHLGYLMAEFPQGEKKAAKSMGEVPKLIDALITENKSTLQMLPGLNKRLNIYKEDYKNAEEASKKFDQKLDAILQNTYLDPLEKSGELGKLYKSDFEGYAKALSPSIMNYKNLIDDTNGIGALPVRGDTNTVSVSSRLNSEAAAPMQRIMRHGLLLGELVKSVPKDDPRYGDLQKVLEQVNELTKVINDQQKNRI